MKRPCSTSGFSLVELLLVLAIIGIISAIAIPSFLGQRRRARIIGDAQANSSVLRMQLESHKADVGLYFTSSSQLSFSWSTSSTPNASTSPAPGFSLPAGTSQMTLNLAIGASGQTYLLTANDRSLNGAMVYQTNQNGSVLYRLN